MTTYIKLESYPALWYVFATLLRGPSYFRTLQADTVAVPNKKLT